MTTNKRLLPLFTYDSRITDKRYASDPTVHLPGHTPASRVSNVVRV